MSAEAAGAPAETCQILVYSDDRAVREQTVLALGRRVAEDLPEIETVECATQAAVLAALDEGGYDLVILDGEAVPAGGMGVCRQIKDEIYDCPPALLLVGRRDDAWLATWSRADGVVTHPVDPVRLPRAAAELLRLRRSEHTQVARG
ncbi:response regulator transcription factor [Granulicoccus phenolivorans]|uniref:response regulator transcription factor n=1 Tax=Granulicoccus phenolivorans TaxID=266854 RepID=UPI00041CA9FF|nr:response regulator transcription factor [Granulicoccus phenolivorans]